MAKTARNCAGHFLVRAVQLMFLLWPSLSTTSFSISTRELAGFRVYRVGIRIGKGFFSFRELLVCRLSRNQEVYPLLKWQVLAREYRLILAISIGIYNKSQEWRRQKKLARFYYSTLGGAIQLKTSSLTSL